jgi:hypothetical protein
MSHTGSARRRCPLQKAVGELGALSMPEPGFEPGPNPLNLNPTVQVMVHLMPEPNLEVRLQVLASMPRTRTGLDRGQSTSPPHTCFPALVVHTTTLFPPSATNSSLLAFAYGEAQELK